MCVHTWSNSREVKIPVGTFGDHRYNTGILAPLSGDHGARPVVEVSTTISDLRAVMTTDRQHPHPENLLGTPAERVLEALPQSTSDLLEGLLAEDLIPARELRAQIPTYIDELELSTRKHEFLDIGLAKKVAGQCLGLLDGIDIDTSEETRSLIQAAVRYFILDDDADSDKESLIGFDDDARVVELVAREIGREDVLG